MANKYGPKIVTDGLVLCVDAASSKCYSGSGTNANDLSGNDYTCTLINGTAFSTDNKGVFIFDGTNDRMSTTATSTYINSTYEIWANRTASGNTFNMILGKTRPYFAMRSENTFFATFRSAGVDRSITSTGITIVNDTWYHVVYTTEYTDPSTVIRLYINGELNTSSTFTGQIDTSHLSTTPFQIGNYNTNTNYSFYGKISSVKLYNIALSATDVINNYNATKGRFGL